MVDCRTGEAHAIPPPPITLPGTSQPELAAVENREWCWQLPFTTLELQHRHNASERPLQASTDTAGFHSMTLAVPEGVISEQFSGEKEVRDPDGTLILLEVLQD